VSEEEKKKIINATRTKLNSEIVKFIFDNPNKYTPNGIVEEFRDKGANYDIVNGIIKRRAELENIVLSQKEVPKMATKKQSLKADRKALKERELGRYNEHNYREALAHIEKLEAMVDFKTKLGKSRRPHEIKPSQNKGVDEATVLACGSDWHIGSKVLPEQVQGLNEFNMDIARLRVDEFFRNIVRLADKERQDVKITDLVLFLGGDMIDGALHLDTIMSNEVSETFFQAVACQNWIESGLLLLEKNFDQITIVCKDGNHGRVTHKIHHSSRQGNSAEWYMYHNLAQRMPQFTWLNDIALHTYLPIYSGHKGGRVIRFHHGDTISYGGVNGFYTYLNRRRYQWNIARPADIDVLGHLHQYTPTKRWIVNGSLVGYNPFSVSLGAEYEVAQQAFALIDKKRGLTVNIPILFSK